VTTVAGVLSVDVTVIAMLAHTQTTDSLTHTTNNLPNSCKQHTHTFNGPLSGTTQVSLYQKGKTNLDFTTNSTQPLMPKHSNFSPKHHQYYSAQF